MDSFKGPTNLSLMRPSVIPLAFFTSGDTWWSQWVMEAGCSIRLSTPPRLTASTITLVLCVHVCVRVWCVHVRAGGWRGTIARLPTCIVASPLDFPNTGESLVSLLMCMSGVQSRKGVEIVCVGKHSCSSQTRRRRSDSTLLIANLYRACWCHNLS